MIILNNYELFVDKRVSKTGKEYYALFISLDNVEFVVSFITKSTYEKLSNLSK